MLKTIEKFYSVMKGLPYFDKARMLMLLLTALHVAIGAYIGLSIDEAHYLLYARHLDWSYFDHPPLVGWAQWPLVALGAPVWLLRMLPAACWLLAVWGVYRLSVRWAQAMLQSSRQESSPEVQSPNAVDQQAQLAGFWAVLAVGLAPMLHVLAVGMLPDTLLMALQVWITLQVWDLVVAADSQQPTQTMRPWLWLGLLLGLAGLSKYTAAFAVLPIAVLLLLRYGWQLLRSRAVWLALLLAVLCITPVLAWNALNDWASFRYQLAHGQGSQWRWLEVARFVVLQVLLYGPLLWVAVVGLWRARGVYLARAVPLYGLAAIGVVPWLLLAYMAGGGSSLPHWTAPSWLVLAPAAGWVLSRAQGWWRVVRNLLAGVQLLWLLGLIALVLSAGRPLLPRSDAWPASEPNPFADLYGWDSAGQHALQLAQQEGVQSLSVQNWTLASRIAWYAAPLPVHVLAPGRSQFDWWAKPLTEAESTLLVDWSQMAYELPLRSSTETGGFTSCRMLDEWAVHQSGLPLSRFRFWVCKGWAGEPQPRLVTAGH